MQRLETRNATIGIVFTVDFHFLDEGRNFNSRRRKDGADQSKEADRDNDLLGDAAAAQVPRKRCDACII